MSEYLPAVDTIRMSSDEYVHAGFYMTKKCAMHTTEVYRFVLQKHSTFALKLCYMVSCSQYHRC